MYFEWINKLYDEGFYDKTDVADFVEYGEITEAQYQEITGEGYVA